MKSNCRVIDVRNGSLVDYKTPLHPDMLKTRGMVVKTGMDGIKVKYGREYVASKIKHDIIDVLKSISKEEMLQLVEEAYNKG